MDKKRILAQAMLLAETCRSDAEALTAIKELVNSAESPEQMRRVILAADTIARLRWDR